MKRSAAHGTLPVPPEEKFEILVFLAQDSDPTLREAARQTLLGAPAAQLAAYLSTSRATPELLSYFAERSPVPQVLRAIVAQPATPLEILVKLVEKLPADVLAEFLRCPVPTQVSAELLEALERNPHHTEATREQLEEWKLGLLATEAEEEEKVAPKATEAEAEPEEEKRVTVQQKIGKLSAAQKVALALKGTKDERQILIKDGNKVVARAVLQSPKVGDGEVESFASLKNVSEEVLRTIAATRKFNKNYNIVRTLVNNPRFPLDLALRMMQRLNNNDLKTLTGNRNLAETLRTAALKLHKQRTVPPGGGGGSGH